MCWTRRAKGRTLSAVGFDVTTEAGSAPEAVAGAVNGDDIAVEEEPVEDGGGEDFVTEDLAPSAEVLARGEDDRALLVALGDRVRLRVRGAGSRPGRPPGRRAAGR